MPVHGIAFALEIILVLGLGVDQPFARVPWTVPAPSAAALPTMEPQAVRGPASRHSARLGCLLAFVDPTYRPNRPGLSGALAREVGVLRVARSAEGDPLAVFVAERRPAPDPAPTGCTRHYP